MINNANDGSGERLFLIRKALRMTQIDFAKIINSSNGHVSDMEKDRKNITDSTIELLMLKCNISEDYIRYGIGEMFIKTPSSTMEQLKKEFNLDDFSFNLVYKYLKLDDTQRKAVRDFFYQVINPEDDTDYISEAPKTPDDLEEQFPPVKVEGKNSKTG
jgi:transcriptional regulator with XRE-family HTH domain